MANGAGIRQYLNTAGIGNERIGWNPEQGVLVDDKAIVNPQQYTNVEGTTYSDPNIIRQGLGKAGLLPQNQVKVRDYLVGQGLDNERIGWEGFGEQAGAISYDGRNLLQTGQFNLRDGSSYADRDVLNRAIQQAGIISPQIQRSESESRQNRAMEDLRQLYSGGYDLTTHPIYGQLEELYGTQAERAISGAGDELAGRGFTTTGSQFSERVAQIRSNANINLLKDVYGIREQEILGLYDLYDREGDEAYNTINQEINNAYRKKEDAIRTWEIMGSANEEVSNILGVEPNTQYTTASGREALAVAKEETNKQRVYGNAIIEQARQGRLAQETYSGALVRQAQLGKEAQSEYSKAIKYQADKGVEGEQVKATSTGSDVRQNLIKEGERVYKDTLSKEERDADWEALNEKAQEIESIADRSIWFDQQLENLYLEFGKAKAGIN